MTAILARASFCVALFIVIFVSFFAVATRAPAPNPVAVATIPGELR